MPLERVVNSIMLTYQSHTQTLTAQDILQETLKYLEVQEAVKLIELIF